MTLGCLLNFWFTFVLPHLHIHNAVTLVKAFLRVSKGFLYCEISLSALSFSGIFQVYFQWSRDRFEVVVDAGFDDEIKVVIEVLCNL